MNNRFLALLPARAWTAAPLGFAILLLTILFAASPPPAFATSFVVDTSSDSAGLTACTGAAADCSLRGAIINANANGGADTITFDVTSVTLGSSLPSMTSGSDTVSGVGTTITIDGVTGAFDCFTISGEASDGNTIEGLGIQGCATAIRIEAGSDNNTIGGTTAAERNVISGNTLDGVVITDSGTTGNTISGNYIGTDTLGTTALPNVSDGIEISASATGNTIGGTTAGHRNVISGNGSSGVRITGSGTATNTVAGNYIGTDAGGTADLGNGVNGVIIDAAATGNTIGGTMSVHRNVISGNGSDGVQIAGASSGNFVRANYIGTNAAGTTALGNAGYGVNIIGSSDNNTVGGSTVGERNVISGNSYGVVIGSTSSSGNMIQGNYVGTNAAGTAAVANTQNAVHITGPGNTVGGVASTPGTPPGNVLSGNGQVGISVLGESADGNAIYGNLIGTDAAGTADLGNGDLGVYILSGADGTLVGSATSGHRNVISGNAARGVGIFDASTTGNIVAGNYVGTNIYGTALAAGTQSNGVTIADGGVQSNVVGGTTTAERNVISGNTGDGVKIGESSHAIGNTVQGNYIGVTADGVTALGNGGHGVVVVDASSNANSVGVLGANRGNVIANNGGDGVYVAAGTQISIKNNSIYANGGLGIDLGADGITSNDVGDGDTGANELMNFPVITSVSYNAGTNETTISGTKDTPSADTAVIDVYASSTADPSGNGEGQVLLTGVGGSAPGIWNLVVSGPLTLPYLSATATDALGNTSEFSPVPTAIDPDGDGINNSADNCDIAPNPQQIDTDADGVGDVCDSAVRNRYNVTQNSLDIELTSEPGEDLPIDNRAFHEWDYQAGSGIDIGSLVGSSQLSLAISLTNGPCVNSYDSGAFDLFNATTVNTANLFDTVDLNGDADTDGILNGVEGYPRFLNSYLDPDRLQGIDNDSDGLVDEDPAGGGDNDGDGEIDEDPPQTATIPAPHARYFGAYGAASFVNVLVFEETADTLYRVVTLFGDPFRPLPVTSQTICGPLEFTMTINDANADNPASVVVEGGDAVLVEPASGTKLFRMELVPAPDGDGDGISNNLDNCPLIPNSSQADADADAIGDGCEPSSGACFGVSTADCDSDGYLNASDNCPTVANATQTESEARMAMPFGFPSIYDEIGDDNGAAQDGCDPDPLSANIGNVVSISRYSSAVCAGVSIDTDGDGWCAGDDPNATDAAITPEGTGVGGAGDAASCTNGVDDDGGGGTDFADSDCPDADGDRVIDSVDVCRDAADPLQLDDYPAYGSGVNAGDACHVTAGGAQPLISRLEEFPSGTLANGELRGRVALPAPKMLFNVRSGYREITDADWTIVPGSSVPNGAIRDIMSTTIGTTLSPSITCNYTLPVTWTLVDASTDYTDTVATGTNYATLLADGNANGLPDGVDKMPLFLTTASVLDDDGDGLVDEDKADAVDNDGDGRIDEDHEPIARLFDATSPPHATQVLNVLIYDPVPLDNDGDGFVDEDPIDGINNDGTGGVDEDPEEGYIAQFILGDPSISPLVGSVSAFCSPFDAYRTRLGVTVDNPATAANEGGVASLANSTAGVTENFFTRLTTQPDMDGDLIENGLDTCYEIADNDLEGGPDNTDSTPWNPRLVAPPGDPDLNGVPEACEVFGGAGFGVVVEGSYYAASTDCTGSTDCDGDGVNNTADNCPTVNSTTQLDTDGDGLGDACDLTTTYGNGGSQTFDGGQPVCNGATDVDHDGFCAAIDIDDTRGLTHPNQVGAMPEVWAFLPALCNDDVDNDNDSDIDIDGFGAADPDTGCQDQDLDGLIDSQDNCPATYNPTQLDSDGDSTSTSTNFGQQPFLRSSTQQPIGAPAAVLGQPFLRSDKWGGDACDPDDDKDYLPDATEPGGACSPAPSNPTLNEDCDNDGLGDLAEYVFSSSCVTTGTFTCPADPCLSFFSTTPIAPDTDVGGGDGLSRYGEAIVHLNDTKAATYSTLPQTSPNPCVKDDDVNNDNDADTGAAGVWKNGIERYLGTNKDVRCSATTAANDEAVDSHPMDLTDSKAINILDVLTFIPVLNTNAITGNAETFKKRNDLNASGTVNILDVLIFINGLNTSCT